MRLHPELTMRLAALSLLAVLTVLPASAQRSRPWAEKGDVALVVSISGGGLTDLTPALGGIGVRYRVTDRTVVGTSVGFDYATFDEDGSDASVTERGLRLALWNENHLGRRTGLVSPFLGAGATFSVNNQEREFVRTPCDDVVCPGAPQRESASGTVLSFGVGALLGAEVRLARGVTLGAAYTLGVAVDRESQESTFNPNPPGDRTIVRVGTGVSDLNLSVYF